MWFLVDHRFRQMEQAAGKIVTLRMDMDAPKNFGHPIVMASQDTPGEVTLYLYDVIGYPWIEAQDVINAVPKGTTKINLRMNSPGGSVFEGLAIYNWLAGHSAEVHGVIDGLAASVMSIIAMACKTLSMPPASFFMIHDPWAMMVGSASELRKEADLLEAIEVMAAEVYAAGSGQDVKQLRQWMHEETWWTGAGAVEAGFATTLIDPDGQADGAVQSRFNLSIFDRAPQTAPNSDPDRKVYQRAAAAIPTNNSQDKGKKEDVKMSEQLRKMLEAKGLAADATEEQAQKFMEDLLAGDLDKAEKDTIRAEAAKVEKDRQNEIRKACRIAGLDGAFAEKLVSEDVPVAKAREMIFLEMEKVNPPLASGRISGGETAGEKFREAASDAMVLRAGIRLEKPAPGAESLRGYEITQIIRESLKAAGADVSMLNSRRAVADFVFNSRQMSHTTSDFPEIFRDAANKVLQRAYEYAPATYQPWTSRVTASDFKAIYGIALSEAPDIELVTEAGEYTYGAMKEKRESYRVFKYGKIIKLTFEMMVNDDLRAFTRLPQLMGAAAKRKENELVYGLLTSGDDNHGPTMVETGRQLFHATEGNLLQTGKAINAAHLDAARLLMRAQKGLNGTRLNLNPAFIIVSPKNEMTTDILLTSAGNVLDHKNKNVVNPWQGKLQSIVEAALLDYFSDGDGWYMIASPNQIDTFEVAFLDGYETPQISEREGFVTDSIEWKVRHFFGVGAMEYRGMVLNDGTA